MKNPEPVSIPKALAGLRFLANRTPHTSSEEKTNAFATIADFRNGGVFVGHYAGYSEWERHPHGDELVFVVEGVTTLILLVDGCEVPHQMEQGELLVVPQDTWHRFETPDGVKIMTVTPQPTDHSVDHPGES